MMNKEEKIIEKTDNTENTLDDYDTKNSFLISLENQLHESKEKILKIQLTTEEEILNVYNRTKREIEQCRKFSLEKIIIDFLPIIDSIECALNLIKNEKSEEKYIEIIKKLKLVDEFFKDTLNFFNIKKIDQENVIFNPDIHQAMSIYYSNEMEPNQIVKIMQSGYILHKTRLLRPAMVTVSKKKI